MGVSKDNTWGYHGGADVTYLLARHIGIGTTVRYSRASHNTVNYLAATGDLFENGVWGAAESNGTVDMKHGGFHWNGGVSVRF